MEHQVDSVFIAIENQSTFRAESCGIFYKAVVLLLLLLISILICYQIFHASTNSAQLLSIYNNTLDISDGVIHNNTLDISVNLIPPNCTICSPIKPTKPSHSIWNPILQGNYFY